MPEGKQPVLSATASPRPVGGSLIARPGLLTAAAGYVLLVFVLLAHYPVIGHYFRRDDFIWLATAERWQNSPEGILALRSGEYGTTTTYNPIFATIYAFAGSDHPAPYYIWLILTHWLTTVGVFLLGRRIGGNAVGMIGAAAFAVFWGNHQTVTWIASGPRPLEAVFFLGSVLLFIWHRDTHRRPLMWGSAALALLALFTKEDAASLILILAAADAFLLDARPWARDRIGAYVPILAAYVIYALLQPWVRADVNLSGLNEGIYWLGPHAIRNLLDCVPQLLIPDLSRGGFGHVAARVFGERTLPTLAFLTGFGRILFTIGAAWLIVRSKTAARFLAAWMYVTFLPFTMFTYEYAVSNRYRYLPAIGFCLLLGWGAGRLLPRLRGRKVAVAAACTAAFLFLAINIGFLRFIQKDLAKADQVRKAAIGSLTEHVPSASPGTVFRFEGLPNNAEDAVLAVTTLYGWEVIGLRPKDEGEADCIVRFEGSQVVEITWPKKRAP